MKRADNKSERIAPVGYINGERRHGMISIFHPSLLNADTDSVQVVISIAGLRFLQAQIGEFLSVHVEALPDPALSAMNKKWSNAALLDTDASPKA